MLLCMFVRVLGVLYQYKTLVTINIIDLNVLLNNLNCTKVAVYFGNNFFAG